MNNSNYIALHKAYQPSHAVILAAKIANLRVELNQAIALTACCTSAEFKSALSGTVSNKRRYLELMEGELTRLTQH